MDIQKTIDSWGGFKHDPETCAYCKDEKLGRGLVPPVTAYERHLAAKLVELEKHAQGQAREISGFLHSGGDNGVY